MRRTPVRPSQKPIKRSPLRSSRKPISARRKDPARRAFAKHRDPEYEKWIEAMCCMVCGGWPTDPAHVEKRGRGSDDRENLLPLCRACHDAQEGQNAAFQREHRIDLGAVAKKLTALYLQGCDATDVSERFGFRREAL